MLNPDQEVPEPLHTAKELLKQSGKPFVLIADHENETYFFPSAIIYAYAQANRLIRDIEYYWDKQREELE